MDSNFKLEIFEAIGDLKKEVDKLREEVSQLKLQSSGRGQQEKISIKEVREYIKEQLLKQFHGLRFSNGSRDKGKLVISSDQSKKIERILIRTSKSFREDDQIPSGWITLNKDLLERYELYFFAVKDFDFKIHLIILKQADLIHWIHEQGKLKDKNGNYHFYLNLIGHKWIDDRENEYEFTKYYNNWSAVSDLLS